MRLKRNTCYLTIFLFSMSAALGICQSSKTAQAYPAHLPYAFSNFVWWNDDELRGLLKKKLPSLGDEISPTRETEAKISDALTALLKEKGITADVLSENPSSFVLTAEQAPGAPPPAVIFSVLHPRIQVDKVTISQAPENLIGDLNNALHSIEGREYSSQQDWLVKSNTQRALESKGFLQSSVEVSHGSPRHEGDKYLVDLEISVKPGPQFHISAITADGGPLLQGRDLSQYFAQKAGDIAGSGPFGRLIGQIRSLYWHAGYSDVAIQGPPMFEPEKGLVSYHLTVVPGPLYHLRSLSIHNLDTQQEQRVRDLLAMKPGDIADEIAINGFNQKLASDPLMKSYGFTFGPKKDASTASMDLTLDFFKVSDKSSVTVR